MSSAISKKYYNYFCISIYFLSVALVIVSVICQNIVYGKITFLLNSIITFLTIFFFAKSFYHPLMLFFFAFQYFIGGGIILDCISPNINFAKTHFFTTYTFSIFVQNKMLLICNSIQLAICFSAFSIKITKKTIIGIKNSRAKQIAWIILISALFIKIYSNLLIIKQVFFKGYISIYLNPINFPVFIRMGDDLFLPAIALILCFKLNKNELKIINITLIFISIMGLFTGARSSGLTFLLLAISIINYYTPLNNRSFIKFAFAVAFLVIFAQVIRVNEDLKPTDLLNNLVGSIVPTIGYGVQYEEKFIDAIPILFNLVLNYINYFVITFTGNGFLPNFPNGPSELLALQGHDSAARISYLANPSFYLAGMGMGTSCYLEFYWIGGIFFVFVGTLISIHFMLYLQRKFYDNYIARFLYIIFLGGWFLSQRTSALEYLNLFYLIKFIPLIVIMYLVFFYLKRREVL